MDITINDRYFLRAETSGEYTLIDTTDGAIVSDGFANEFEGAMYVAGCYTEGAAELEALLGDYPDVEKELTQQKKDFDYRVRMGQQRGFV